MDDERLVVEVEKYVELYDQSSRHYKDNSKKVIAWRAIALEIGSSADFLPPPPPPTRDGSALPSLGFFPPPPPAAPYEPQMKGPEKTLQERRSSLDAEIDSLTSILADLESSSPYKPRPAQVLTAQTANPFPDS
ncbi:unnamed protein product [Boreogadus saida]